jgi:hypothetical protein
MIYGAYLITDDEAEPTTLVYKSDEFVNIISLGKATTVEMTRKEWTDLKKAVDKLWCTLSTPVQDDPVYVAQEPMNTPGHYESCDCGCVKGTD